MYLLDYERKLHQSGNDRVEFTVERCDETATYRYTALIAVEDLLFVRELIDGDVTTTTYAVFLNRADEIDGLWAGRVVVDYVRYDIIKDLILNFYQLFDNADASGAFGGTTEDPTTIAYLDASNGKLCGVAVIPTGDTVNHRCNSTIDTPIQNYATVTACMSSNPLNTFVFEYLHIKSSDDSLIASVGFGRGSGNQKISVTNSSGNTVATVFSKSAPFISDLIDFRIELDLPNKKLSIFSNTIVLSDNLDLDISNSGTMTETNVGNLGFQISTFLGNTNGESLCIDNLVAYQGETP
jgi:hypothetical protein